MKNKLKILHLEDTPADAELVERELKKGKIQFEKLVVDNKTAFEKALTEFAPDIVITDHSLPSFDSLEAIRIMKQKGIKIPVILVTATVSDEYAVEIMKAGADDYILKDRLHRLPQAVLNAMEKYNLESAKEAVIDKLISSQLHLKEAQGITKIGSWETDLQTFNLKWSDQTHHIFGTDPKGFQVTYEIFLDFIHPDDRNKVITALENSLTSQSDTSVEHRIISTNGTLKHVIENWKIIQDDKGYPVRAVGTCQDVTERKLTEIDLLESREEMQTVFNASLDAVIIIDEEGKITKWDSKAELLFGWKEEEVIGTLLSDNIIPLGLREAHKQGMKHFLKTGEGNALNKTIEVHALKKDKTEINISLSISPSRAKNKYQFIGFVRDISERKVVEQALQKSESNMKAIFESTSEGFILVDTNGIVKAFNNKTAQTILLNTEQRIKIGSSIYDFIHSSKKENYKGIISKVLAGETIKYDSSFERKNGDTKWFSFSINPVYNKADEIEGVCITSADITERKKADKALQESETFSKGVLASLSSHIAVVDESGTLLEVNKGWDDFAKANGVSTTELTGKGSNYFDECKRASAAGDKFAASALEGIISVLKKEKQIYQLEYPCHSPTLQRWFTMRVMNFESDKPAVVVAHLDITERIIAEQKLKESEIKYRSIIETTDEMINALSPQGEIVFANNAWQKNLLYSNEDLKNLKLDDILSEETKKGFKERIQKIRPGETIRDLSATMIDKNGESIQVEGTVVPRIENGKVIGTKCFFRNVTEKKKAEANLRQSEFKLKEAQAIAHLGNWEVDLINHKESWSDEMYKIYGLVVGEVIPSTRLFLSFIHPDDLANALNIVNNSCSKSKNFSFNFRFIRKDKEVRYGYAEARFQFDKHKKPLRIYGILKDITQGKLAEAEREKIAGDLIQRNRDLEQFSFIISHNLRAPTANIIGFTEYLNDETLSPSEHKEFLQNLSSSVEKLDLIIKDINTILQVRRDVNEKKESLSFSTLVNNIVISIGNLIAKHHVRIVQDFSEIDEIYSLRVYLHSIFYNLISNSIKYGNPDKQTLIKIKSKKENGKIILTFKDNGLGINMKTKGDKIFGLYNRFHSHVEGKGMGLYMVKTQVESLGGKITIASELNKGTEFTIVFEN